MSSSEKPPTDPDEVNRSKSDNLSTKSTPHITHHNDKSNKTEKKLANRTSKFSQSDANIVKVEDNVGVKKKINKMWMRNSGKDATNSIADVPMKDAVEAGLVAEMDNLNFNNSEGVEDGWVHSELVHARDSLENLNSSSSSPQNTNRAATTSGDLGNSKSTNFPQEKFSLAENPCSDSSLGNSSSSNEPSSSAARVLTWDPWSKMGRKPKKENKRRKMAEKHQLMQQKPEQPQEIIMKESAEPPQPPLDEEPIENYEYQPYQNPLKTVEFTSEVMVVYFNGDEVVGESKEPLKKEIEQQLRNKEMRKGHLPTMLGTKRKFPEDFRGAWF